jgi:TRAP-type mannitol/chloroaromatic compound transport system substrate-binding protein
MEELVKKEGVIARPLPDDVIKALRSATEKVLAEGIAKDPTTKKVHQSYFAFKQKYDAWAGYSEAVYHSKIRGA